MTKKRIKEFGNNSAKRLCVTYYRVTHNYRNHLQPVVTAAPWCLRLLLLVFWWYTGLSKDFCISLSETCSETFVRWHIFPNEAPLSNGTVLASLYSTLKRLEVCRSATRRLQTWGSSTVQLHKQANRLQTLMSFCCHYIEWILQKGKDFSTTKKG